MRRSVSEGPAEGEVAIVRRRRLRYRSVFVTAVVTAVVTAIVIAGFSLSMSAGSTSGVKATCSKSTSALTTSSASTLSNESPRTTLPPSRDNDVGDGRVPDRTPDADVDANQRAQICSALK